MAQPLTDDQKQVFKNNVDYFNTERTEMCGVGNSTVLEGSDNIQKSYNYFLSKGFKPHQSAGIVGNLRQESGSGIDPKSNQPNGPGRGIAQWSEGGRWDALIRWAGARDPEALDTQLDFIWHELNNVQPWSKARAPLLAAATLEEAEHIFLVQFEVAGDPHEEQRIQYGKEVLEMYGDAASGVGGSCRGVNIDGYAFPVAPQTKRDYTSMPCDADTVRYTPDGGSTVNIKTCHHDGSPAFDLMYYRDGTKQWADGHEVYAITDGKIVNMKNGYHGVRNCFSIQFSAQRPQDDSFYWYGHVQDAAEDLIQLQGKPNQGNDPRLTPEGLVKAGTVLAKVATADKTSSCWGGGQHLHIDRGCRNRTGDWHTGGNQSCRDPGFLDDLRKIWEGLPAA